MAERGRTCRKRSAPVRDELEIDIEGEVVRVRAGRRLVCTLAGRDAATARTLASDPDALDRFIASRVASSRKIPA